MYAWLWRVLPGSGAARGFQLLAMMLVVLTILWFWVFPWVSDTFSLYSFLRGGTPVSPYSPARGTPAAATG